MGLIARVIAAAILAVYLAALPGVVDRAGAGEHPAPSPTRSDWPIAHQDSTILTVESEEPSVRAATPDPAPRPVIVVASWYGPGFYGNRTACGQTYTPVIAGVAHRTLPCGAVVTLRYGDRTFSVPVIDRGPFVAGREFDLSAATREALGCSDLCRVEWVRP